MYHSFCNLLPYPRVLETREECAIYSGRVTLSFTEGLTATQTADFSRLTARVFETEMAPGGLEVTVRLDPGHAPAVLSGVSANLQVESYELTVGTSGIVLMAAHFAGLQRGLMTLKQLLEDAQDSGCVPGCRILDWPRLAIRGIHYDLAREMECRPAHLRRIVERLAYFKMNTFHLYLEGQFAFASAPEVTPKGAMTAEDARELSEYARVFGITLIPQIATLGHMNMLLHGPYAALREHPATPFNLCPTHPQARPFIAGLIRDIAEAFHPPFIHLGYDESHSGYCERCRQQGTPQELLAEYLNWMNEEVKKHGIRSMIYGDKFLSPHDFPMADAVNGGTPEEARDALSRISRDIVITDWHYTAPSCGTSRHLVEEGFEVHLGTAVNTYWHDSIPFHRAQHWIAETIDQAAVQGIQGAFNCNWELYRGIFFENNWLFQALAAERYWTDRPHDFAAFSKRFSARFWGTAVDYYAEIAGVLESIPINRRVTFLDSSVMAECITVQARWDYQSLADYLDGRIEALRTAARRNGDSLNMLDMPTLIIRYVGARMAGLYIARLAFDRGDRVQAAAAFENVRRVALRVREKLEEGYRVYGGAVRDRERLDKQLQELESVMKSGDPREWVALRNYQVSPLILRQEPVAQAELPPESMRYTTVMNIPQNDLADIRSAHNGRSGILYLRTSAELPHAFSGQLRLGTHDPVKVWVNGVEVGVLPDAALHRGEDIYMLPVNWRQGNNDILFALDTHGGTAWGLYASIMPVLNAVRCGDGL